MSKSPTRRFRPNASGVIAMIALFVALSSSAVAAGVVIKSSKQINPGAVHSSDIKDRTIGVRDLSKKARTALKGATGARGLQGPQGIPGVQGIQGIQGERGPSEAKHAAKVAKHDVGISAASQTITTMTLPKGSYVFSASLTLKNDSGQAGDFACRVGSAINDLEEIVAETTNTLADNATTGFALNGATTVDLEQTTVALECRGLTGANFADVTEAHLVAIRVGTLS